jgi:hypothetical protein
MREPPGTFLDQHRNRGMHICWRGVIGIIMQRVFAPSSPTIFRISPLRPSLDTRTDQDVPEERRVAVQAVPCLKIRGIEKCYGDFCQH